MIKFPVKEKPAEAQLVAEPERQRPPAERAKEVLLTPAQLAKRWSCHKITLRRMGKRLRPVKFTQKLIRYKLSVVEQIEKEKTAAND